MYCVLPCDTLVSVAARSKAWIRGPLPAEIWARIQPGAWVDVCYECCMLSGTGLCDELITCPRSLTEWGASLYVI